MIKKREGEELMKWMEEGSKTWRIKKRKTGRMDEWERGG